MIKRILLHSIPEHEWPVWLVPAVILMVFLLSGIIAYFYYFGAGFGRFDGTTYRPVSNRTLAKVEVGGTLFAIPQNFTRNRNSRRADVLEHIELHALLPNLIGYDKMLAEEFLRTDTTSSLLLLNIRAIDEKMPEKQRFDAIYAPYILGNGDSDSKQDGLQNFRFADNSPYFNKQIFRAIATGTNDKIGEQNTLPPVFLCDKPNIASPTCESRFPLGQTARVNYRFKRIYLQDWKKIDAAVKELIRNFRAAARTF
ncbi:MAG: hypothetical protein ACR2OT_05025 [Parvibaculales bacterium]